MARQSTLAVAALIGTAVANTNSYPYPSSNPYPTPHPTEYNQPPSEPPSHHFNGLFPPTAPINHPTLPPSHPTQSGQTSRPTGKYDMPDECVTLTCGEEGNCRDALFQACGCLHLECTAPAACANATVLCFEDGGDCFVECEGYESCADLTVFQAPSDHYYDAAYDAYGYGYDMHASEQGGRAHVTCKDGYGCEGLTVCDNPRTDEECPVQEFCEVIHCGPGECQNEVFQACDGVCLKLICEGEGACTNSTVYCNAENPEGCMVDCSGDSCLDMNLFQFGDNNPVHLWCDSVSCEGAQWASLDINAPQFNAHGCPVLREDTWQINNPPAMQSFQSIAIITDVQTQEPETPVQTTQPAQTESPVASSTTAAPIAETTSTGASTNNDDSTADNQTGNEQSSSSSSGSDTIELAIYGIAGVAAAALIAGLGIKFARKYSANGKYNEGVSTNASSAAETHRSDISTMSTI